MKRYLKLISISVILTFLCAQTACANQLFYIWDMPRGSTIYYGTANSEMQNNAWYVMNDYSDYSDQRDNGQLSLFSHDALKDKMSYDSDSAGWTNSTLHKYLVGTYYDTAFSTSEKSIIATRLEDSSKVSLMSASNSGDLGWFGNFLSERGDLDSFWTRSAKSSDEDMAYYIFVSSGGPNVVDNYKYRTHDVRPIILLNMNQALFFSSAVGGKSAVKPGDGFSLADASVSNGVKATVVDESIIAPTGISVTQKFEDNGVESAAKQTATGGTLDLTKGVTSTYKNPLISFDSKGSGQYLSVYAQNSSSVNNNYAKISAQESGKDIVLSLDGLKADGAYSLYFYSEIESGDYKTDYASKLSNAFQVYKGTGTAYWGTLSSAYKDSGFNVALGNGFNLSLEKADYNSTINVNSNSAINGNGASVTALKLAEGVTLNLGSELVANGDSGLDSEIKKATLVGSGTLTLGQTATLTGTIDAYNLNSVKVTGKADVRGTLYATNLEVGMNITEEEDIEAEGDIKAKYITFAKGASVNNSGTFTMGGVTALGTRNTINSSLTTAIGTDNSVLASGSTAIGYGNTITGTNTLVLGNNVVTSASNSVVLGSNSTATRNNVVSVGAQGAERQIINVAAGTEATDAVNFAQLSSVSQEIQEVGAISAALAGLHYIEPSGEGDDRVVGAVAYGGYRGQSATAIGLAYKPNADMMFSASTSIGNNQNAYNAGVSFKFGPGKTISRVVLQKRVQKLETENKNLKDELSTVKESNAKLEARLSKLEKIIDKLK